MIRSTVIAYKFSKNNFFKKKYRGKWSEKTSIICFYFIFDIPGCKYVWYKFSHHISIIICLICVAVHSKRKFFDHDWIITPNLSLKTISWCFYNLIFIECILVIVKYFDKPKNSVFHIMCGEMVSSHKKNEIVWYLYTL